MSTAAELLTNREYKYGFVTDIETETIDRGLTEETVRLISSKKNEPEWLLDFRLKAYRRWLEMTPPDNWANFQYPDIDFQNISYYSAPKQKPSKASLDEVDPELLKTFEKLGIGDTGRVIIYGENSGLLAARVFYTLDYLGHSGRAALLDGGIEKWKTEKREVSKVADGFQTATFTPRVSPSVIVEMARVRDLSWQSLSVPAPGVSLIDARPAANYTGDDAGGLQRPGHIPGAVSIYWMQNLVSSENPSMKPVTELKKMYSEAGLKPGDLVVTYCRTGMQASHAYFTAKYLGYNVTMYDGSMSEWVTSEANEVIKGKERK